MLSFAGVSLAFALLPGPNMLFLTATAASRGPRPAWRSALGVETATLLFALLTASGLGALVAASTVVFQTVKWAGVAYLVWLGIQAWREAARPTSSGQVATAVPPGSDGRRGFLVGISNPKVILFFVALLPQFVRPGAGPEWLQLLVFGLFFTVVGLAVDAVFCLTAGSVRRALAGRVSHPVLRRAPALTYFGLAGWAAFTGHRTA